MNQKKDNNFVTASSELLTIALEIRAEVLNKKKMLATICLSEEPSNVKINKITDLILTWITAVDYISKDNETSLADLKQTINNNPSFDSNINFLVDVMETTCSPCKELTTILDEIKSVIKLEITDEEKINKIKCTLI